MPNLTENEIKALKMCLNYNNRASQLSDNFSNAGVEDFAFMMFKGDIDAGEALVSSLTFKNMGDMDENYTGDQNADIFWLSEYGVNTIFDILEAEGELGNF